MLSGKKIVVVMPAYNAARTLEKTYKKIPHQIVDEVILVDDKSRDETVKIAKKLGIKTFIHKKNKGYGANQKTCYREALKIGADIVVMLHPDYQYDPRLITSMASMICEDVYDVVIGSRIVTGGALKGGMPVYKYLGNRFLTLVENLMIGEKLSEYHTGYRAFSKKVLKRLPIKKNSDDFVFDNQMLLQCLFFDFRVGEVSCPTLYNEESSSIDFKRSVKYGLEVLLTGLRYFLAEKKIYKSKIFDK
jgi:glycosyltransferase involved in cell wall biosynthesis